MVCRGSASVEVITTLHGSVSSLRRRIEGCVLSEGTIASTKDPLKSTPILFKATLTLQVESQIIRSGFPLLHVGASEGLQSLFSYSSDPVLPLLMSSRECLENSASLSFSQTTLLHCVDLFFLVQFSISFMLFSHRALSRFPMLYRIFFSSQFEFAILSQS